MQKCEHTLKSVLALVVEHGQCERLKGRATAAYSSSLTGVEYGVSGSSAAFAPVKAEGWWMVGGIHNKRPEAS